MKVSYERWQRAQKSELDEYRDHSVENSFSGFQKVFEYLKLDPKTSFKGKTILEVASGSVPALLMCEGVKGTIVEPLMPYWKDQLLKVQEAGLRLFDKLYEHVIMSDMGIFDETWFFNCLEHVIDPEFQMKKVCGCYWIEMQSENDWGGTRINGSPAPWLFKAHHKNTKIFYGRNKDVLSDRRIVVNRKVS